jgi:hypothetical protein
VARFSEHAAEDGALGALAAFLLSGEGAAPVDQWMADEVDFRRGVLAALEAEAMGPTALARLAEIIEWRFLRRDELLLLGIPDYYRVDYLQWASTIAGNEMSVAQAGEEEGAAWIADIRASNEQLQAKRADLEARARQEVELAPATRRLLESRRRELEALSRDGLRYLPQAADRRLVWTLDG